MSDDEFRRTIYDHYDTSGRRMPWRETDDAYRILVSEIMLQQTQVERVRGAYDRFVARFPAVETLADAPLSDVLALWQGLGYNRRPISLHGCAREMVDHHGGRLPDTVDELLKLPGIGPATAGSLMAFVHGKAVPFIETNIRRVYLHFYFPDAQGVPDADLMPVVERTLDREDPRRWYYALMDYGVMLKKTSGNANRRSTAYKRQPRFEGSKRQIRGAIIRALTGAGSMSEAELLAALTQEGIVTPNERLASVAAELAREGFLRGDAEGWRIA